jgi:hypothetical protein
VKAAAPTFPDLRENDPRSEPCKDRNGGDARKRPGGVVEVQRRRDRFRAVSGHGQHPSYRATAAGRKALAEAKEKLRELFLELFEDEG